ncbi:DUF1127 domain-containing protein [Roseicella frigidaeris]|uniref:DUF1127 domain-containing protein n=1 Tax=Roseicella frigidaeris TaxID=2230885 RepID=UPI001401CAEC|nr:DUF1127 domain-containing protein [Roseicella frigidaeris]
MTAPAIPDLASRPTPAPQPRTPHWLAWLEARLARRAERRQLLALEPRELRDIGLTPAEAWALARAPRRH